MTLPAPADRLADDDVAEGLPLDILLSRVSSGDRAALGALTARLAPDALGLMARMLGSLDQTRLDQLLDEVFAEVWERAQAGTAPSFSAEPWVLALAHRRAAEERDAAHVAA